jgi:hypothetical protein
VPVLNTLCEDDVVRSVDARVWYDLSVLQSEQAKPYPLMTVYGSISQGVTFWTMSNGWLCRHF